jgi:SAM-dependent methyltransferase
MEKYWEKHFEEGGAIWTFRPALSAEVALKYFQAKGIEDVLVPGCGYGRNLKLFSDQGFHVEGIEISKSAIEIAKQNGLDCTFYHAPVSAMPINNKSYDGIFCYALIHLLNKHERKAFLKACYHQLKPGGTMIFVVASKLMPIFASGKKLSNDRYVVKNGLKVFFYDGESVKKEFSEFGLQRFENFDEPVKHISNEDVIKLIYVVCEKV